MHYFTWPSLRFIVFTICITASRCATPDLLPVLLAYSCTLQLGNNDTDHVLDDIEKSANASTVQCTEQSD
jgi:hypothetical protein